MAQAQIEWDEARDDREAEQAAREPNQMKQGAKQASQEKREDSEARQLKNKEQAYEKSKTPEALNIHPPRPKEEMVKGTGTFGVTDWDLYQAALQDINKNEDLISMLSAAKKAESRGGTIAADDHDHDEPTTVKDTQTRPSAENKAKSHEQKNKQVEEDEEEYSGLGVKRRSARIAALDTKKARLS